MSNESHHLIKRFQRGDTTAFALLVEQHQDRIYNLCRRMLGHAQNAEDAAQDTFLKAYRHLGKFTPDASFSTWLYRIAVNTCLDHKKKPFWESLFKKSAGGEECLRPELSHDFSPERLYEAKQMGQVLQACLDRLSPKLRAVILLRELEGCSYEEIAGVMDISPGTVKSRLARAREELRKLIEKTAEQKCRPIV